MKYIRPYANLPRRRRCYPFKRYETDTPRGEKILHDWFVLGLGDLKFNLDIPSFYKDTFQLLTGRVNVFKKMADAFFKIIKQREEDKILTTAYFSEEEMQIMERILEEVHGSDDIDGWSE